MISDSCTPVIYQQSESTDCQTGCTVNLHLKKKKELTLYMTARIESNITLQS